MKVISTATLFARAAILSGLNAVQRDDYPVTVKTGHSISFIKLSEKKIGYLGVESPHVLFVLSKEGLKESGAFLKSMGKNQRVYILSKLPEVETEAQVVKVDPEKLESRVPKEGITLAVLSAYLKLEGIFPAAALAESANLGSRKKIKEKQIRFVESGEPIIFDAGRF
jgi:Pyruvate/2-oxoacid:ferredoxin oxidoreductase gamma subunit